MGSCTHPAQRDSLRLESVDGRLVIVDRLRDAFIFERGSSIAQRFASLHGNG